MLKLANVETAKQVNANASLGNELATCSVSSIHELFDDQEGYGGSEEEEDKDKCEPKPVPSFAKVHTAFQTVQSLFYAHNIGRYDEYILNMERALFGLKHKV
jgi:hypothetical protein